MSMEFTKRAAVDALVAAGMVLHCRSVSGSSYYLGWPGRSGVLRVSDHESRCNDKRVRASLIFREECTPTREERLMRMIARALGEYLINS